MPKEETEAHKRATHLTGCAFQGSSPTRISAWATPSSDVTSHLWDQALRWLRTPGSRAQPLVRLHRARQVTQVRKSTLEGG